MPNSGKCLDCGSAKCCWWDRPAQEKKSAAFEAMRAGLETIECASRDQTAHRGSSFSDINRMARAALNMAEEAGK